MFDIFSIIGERVFSLPIIIPYMTMGVSQVALVVKNLPANAGDSRDVGSIHALGRSPGGGHGNPLQYSCLKNPHGQRSLASYSPRGRKESDMTKQLYTHADKNKLPDN